MPLLGLRRRREDRLGEAGGLAEPRGEGDAADGARPPVVLPARAGEVAARHALERDDAALPARGRSARRGAPACGGARGGKRATSVSTRWFGTTSRRTSGTRRSRAASGSRPSRGCPGRGRRRRRRSGRWRRRGGGRRGRRRRGPSRGGEAGGRGGRSRRGRRPAWPDSRRSGVGVRLTRPPAAKESRLKLEIVSPAEKRKADRARRPRRLRRAGPRRRSPPRSRPSRRTLRDAARAAAPPDAGSDGSLYTVPLGRGRPGRRVSTSSGPGPARRSPRARRAASSARP